MAIYRSDQHSITVSVTGAATDSVSWDYAEGGDLQPEMQTYNPGGMAPAIAVGGLRKRGDLTVRRAWSDTMIGLYKALDDAAGIAPVTVAITPIKADRKTSASKPITYTGILGKVTRPNAEAASSSVVYLEVTVSCNE